MFCCKVFQLLSFQTFGLCTDNRQLYKHCTGHKPWIAPAGQPSIRGINPARSIQKFSTPNSAVNIWNLLHNNQSFVSSQHPILKHDRFWFETSIDWLKSIRFVWTGHLKAIKCCEQKYGLVIGYVRSGPGHIANILLHTAFYYILLDSLLQPSLLGLSL